MRAAELTREQVRQALDLEARGDPRLAHEIRWQLAAEPYQFEPCSRCLWHRRWREHPTQRGCICDSPTKEWDLWLFLAGRGTGKTFTGSHFAVRQSLATRGIEGAIIAPTHADLRNTLIEGPTGIQRVAPRDAIELTRDGKIWNQSSGKIMFKNGSVIRTLSAEKPDRVRGANLAWVWGDEMAAWSQLDYAWEQLEMATRVGEHLKFLVTTTPRPLPLLKYLAELPGTMITNASSYDNPHLSKRFRARLARFEGTRVGEQEIYGRLLSDIDGALWSWALIEDARCPAYEVPSLLRLVVAVDPSGGGKAETGIVVVGLAATGVCYVLADYTMHGTPHEWGSRAVAAYHEFSADRIVGERNFGGDMVESTIRSVDPRVSYKDVNASRGKVLRAEPVVSLYEQHKVKHVLEEDPNRYALLEHQLTNWVPNTGQPSPDRLDAMVWGVTELALGDAPRGTSIADLLAASPGGDTRGSSPWRI